MAPSPTGRQLYRRDNDSIAIRCGVALSPSAHCLAVERLHRHPLSHCDIAPSPSAGRLLYRSTIARSPQGEPPRGEPENPVGRLTIRWTLGLYSVVSLSRMFGTLPDNAIRLFLSNVRESSGGLVHWNVLSLSRTGSLKWLVPLTGM